MKKPINKADIVLFEELTRAALEEADGAGFIGRLLEREKVSGRMAGSSGMLDGDLAEQFYYNEVRVIERLEEERARLMIEIDLYSKSQRAVRSYSPKFPLPPAISFFEQKK